MKVNVRGVRRDPSHQASKAVASFDWLSSKNNDKNDENDMNDEEIVLERIHSLKLKIFIIYIIISFISLSCRSSQKPLLIDEEYFSELNLRKLKL